MVEGVEYGLQCMFSLRTQAGPAEDAMATARALLADGASGLVRLCSAYNRLPLSSAQGTRMQPLGVAPWA